MRLTAYTDYSLRVLMYLGLKGETLSTIDEIARRYDISRNHLMKIVHELSRKGYVETLRGRNGGMRLNRKPEDINVGEIVRALEQDMSLVECFSEDNKCRIAPACVLRHTLHEALDAFFSVLDRYTLEDLLEPQLALGRLLSLTPAEGDGKAGEKAHLAG